MTFRRVCILAALLLCVLMAASATPIPDRQQCRSVNDDSFFNKCRIENPPRFLTALANTVTGWLNPTVLAVTTTLMLLCLPLFTLFNRSPASKDAFHTEYVCTPDQQASFLRAHLFLINVLRRASFTFALNVGLYAVFRQRRPCECLVKGVWSPIGSIYGMPSGDATSGAVVAGLVFAWRPWGTKWLSLLLGVTFIVLKCTERLALGVHSLGQVVTGTVIGLTMSAYAEYLPQYLIIFDVFAQILIGVTALATDSDLHYLKTDSDNIVSWYLWGIGLLFCAAMLLIRFYARRNWMGFRSNFAQSLSMVSDGLTSSFVPGSGEVILDYGASGTDNDREPSRNASYRGISEADEHRYSGCKLARLADFRFTVLAFIVFTVGILLSNCLVMYGWGFDD